jgi:hypothetical protein
MHKIKNFLFITSCLLTPLQLYAPKHPQTQTHITNFKTPPKESAKKQKFTIAWATQGTEYDQKAEFSYSRLTKTQVAAIRKLIQRSLPDHTIILSKPDYERTLTISPSCLTSPILLKFLQHREDFKK